MKCYQYDFEGAAQKLKVAVAEEQRKAEVKLAIKRAKKEARLAKLQQEAALRLKKKQDDKIAQSQAAMMAAHMKARAQMQVDILAVLNNEQKAEFDKIMQRFERQKHGKGKKSKDKKTHSH